MASSDTTSTYTCITCGAESTGLDAAWKHKVAHHDLGFRLQVEGEPQQYSHFPRETEDGDLLCPVCKHADVSTWADDGEADFADWWQCEAFSGGCGAHGAVRQSRARLTLNGLEYPE